MRRLCVLRLHNFSDDIGLHSSAHSGSTLLRLVWRKEHVLDEHYCLGLGTASSVGAAWWRNGGATRSSSRVAWAYRGHRCRHVSWDATRSSPCEDGEMAALGVTPNDSFKPACLRGAAQLKVLGLNGRSSSTWTEPSPLAAPSHLWLAGYPVPLRRPRAQRSLGSTSWIRLSSATALHHSFPVHSEPGSINCRPQRKLATSGPNSLLDRCGSYCSCTGHPSNLRPNQSFKPTPSARLNSRC